MKSNRHLGTFETKHAQNIQKMCFVKVKHALKVRTGLWVQITPLLQIYSNHIWRICLLKSFVVDRTEGSGVQHQVSSSFLLSLLLFFIFILDDNMFADRDGFSQRKRTRKAPILLHFCCSYSLWMIKSSANGGRSTEVGRPFKCVRKFPLTTTLYLLKDGY